MQVGQMVRAGKMKLARGSLVKQLSFNLEAAKEHEINGIAQGSRVYVLLFEEAHGLLAEYAVEFLVPRVGTRVARPGQSAAVTVDEAYFADSKRRALEMLYAQFPAMSVMQHKAKQPAEAVPAGTGAESASVAGVPVSDLVRWALLVLMVIFVVVGLFQAESRLLTRWIGA